VLLPGGVPTLLSRLCCPKISLPPEGKLPWHIDPFLPVSSVVKYIGLTVGLGSWISCLRQELLKAPWFLVKELHNVCLIALVICSVTDRRTLEGYFCFQSSDQKRDCRTSADAMLCLLREALLEEALSLGALPSTRYAVSLVCVPGDWRDYTPFSSAFLQPSPASIVTNTVMRLC